MARIDASLAAHPRSRHGSKVTFTFAFWNAERDEDGRTTIATSRDLLKGIKKHAEIYLEGWTGLATCPSGGPTRERPVRQHSDNAYFHMRASDGRGQPFLGSWLPALEDAREQYCGGAMRESGQHVTAPAERYRRGSC